MLDSKSTFALPVGLSVDEIESLYNSFYTQRLADECRLISSKLREFKTCTNDNEQYIKRDLNRRLRIARRLLAKRQLRMFE
jgi:tRNA A37 N6-isopentenylltransferase MiaA